MNSSSPSKSTVNATRGAPVRTILFGSEAPTDSINHLNRHAISVHLEALAQDAITDVNINGRRKIMANEVIDVKNRISLDDRIKQNQGLRASLLTQGAGKHVVIERKQYHITPAMSFQLTWALQTNHVFISHPGKLKWLFDYIEVGKVTY